MTTKQIEIHRVGVDAATRWLARSWELFAREPGMWLLYTVVIIIASLCLGLISVLGALVWAFAAPILFAGALFVAARIDRGEPVDVTHFFVGFTDRAPRTQIMILGAISALSQLVIGALALLMIGGSVFAALAAGDVSGLAALLGGILGSLAVVLVLSLAVAAGIFYACPLVLFRGADALEAIKASYRVSIVNLVPLTVAGLIFAVLAIVATVPVGLGWLVLIPLTVTAAYVSYAEMFPPSS